MAGLFPHNPALGANLFPDPGDHLRRRRRHVHLLSDQPSVTGLPAGTNVVAVEVHRFSPSQASLSFDLELFGAGAFAPLLAASRAGADFTVRWPATNNAGFILLSGTNLTQPAAWSPLGGPYPLNGGSYEYREPLILSQAANFYRLQYVGVPATGPKLGWVLDSNAFRPFLAEQLRRLRPRDLRQPAARRPLADRRRTLSAEQRLFRAVGPQHPRPSAVLSPSQAPALTGLGFKVRSSKFRAAQASAETGSAAPDWSALSRLIGLAGLLFSPVAEDRHFEGLVPVSLDHEDHHKDQDAEADEKRDRGEDNRQEMYDGGHRHWKRCSSR